MVTICDKVSSFDAVHAVAMAHDDIWCTVGTHPHEAKENPDLTAETLSDLAGRPRWSASARPGSTSTTTSAPRHPGQGVPGPCRRRPATGLPLVVHTREADAVMGDILEDEHAAGPFKLLMHCYTSGPELAGGRGAGRLVLGVRHRHLQGGRGGAGGDPRHARRPDHPGDRLPLPGARADARPAQRAGLPAAYPGQAGGDPRLDAWRRPRRAPRTPSSPCSTGFRDRDARMSVWSSPSSAAALPAACRARTAPGAPAIRPSRSNRRSRCSLLVRRKAEPRARRRPQW